MLTLMGMSNWVKKALKCLAKSSGHLIMFYSQKIDGYVNFYAKNIRKRKNSLVIKEKDCFYWRAKLHCSRNAIEVFIC